MVLLAALTLATASPLAKLAESASPLMLAWGRCAVAAVLLAPSGAGELLHCVRRGYGMRLFGVGVLLGAHLGLYFAGLLRTSLAAAVAFVALEPIAVLCVAGLWFGFWPVRREQFAVVLAVVGVLVVAAAGDAGEHSVLGDVLVLLAVALYGVYVMSARKLKEAVSPLGYAFAVYAVAALALLPFAALDLATWSLLPKSDWGIILALGMIPTLLGHTALQLAARSVRPSMVALVPAGETLGSVALGVLVLRQWPSINEALGMLAIVAAAVLVVTASGRSSNRGTEHSPNR